MFNNSSLPCFNNISCQDHHGPQLSHEMASLLSLRKSLLPILSGVGLASLSISLIGNLLITWILLTDKRFRTMAQFFLVNVAIAEATYAALNIVGEVMSLTMSLEALMATFCKLYRPLIAVRFAAYAISVFCLASLSVERCHAICSPMNFHASNSSFKNRIKIGLFAFLWITAIALSAPLGVCKVKVSKAYVICLAVLLHAIPLTIISVANLKIIISLCKATGAEPRSTAQRDTGGLLKLLVLLIVSVLLFWSPYHVLFLYHTFHGPPTSPEGMIKWEIALYAGNTLTYFNSALHGFLYYAFCKSFRVGLKSLLVRCLPHCMSCSHQATFSKNASSETEEQVVCRGITNVTNC